jgi:hypothetical protein
MDGRARVSQDEGHPRTPSVFGTVNQDDMIARIDSTAEDDLSSAFFGDSIQEVEDAAVRMFDIGIRTITDDPARPSSAAFGTPPPPASSGRAARVPSAVEQPVAASVDGPFEDPRTRAAFILGGPDALRS